MLSGRRIFPILLCIGVLGCGADRRAAERWASQAIERVAEGDLEEAGELVTRALGELEASALVQEAAGRLALARMQPDRAVDHLRAAIDLEDAPRRRGLLGRALVGAGRLDDAADQLESALAQAGRGLELRRDAVYVFSRTGRKREALRLAEKLLQEDSGSPATRIRVAGAMVAAGEPEQARGVLRTLDASLVTSAEDLALLGAAHYELQQATAAVRALERACEQVPGNPGLLYNLGTARLLGEDFTRAREDFRQVLELAPGDALARGQLAFCLARTGRRESALEELRKARELAPEDRVLQLLEQELAP